MFKRLKQWYVGTGVFYSLEGHGGGYGVEYHWTAKFARALVQFWLFHWKWIIGTAIALFALYLQWALNSP